MKPVSIRTRSGRTQEYDRPLRCSGFLLCIALQALTCARSAAVVPIPDAIIYGTIAIQNRAVTNSPASTNVVVQAQRISDGQVMASYAMGSASSQGQFFYVLRISMEDAPASSTQLAQPGDSFVITVTKLGTVVFTATNIVPTSGSALRLDFGASVDTNGDGIPDDWELAHLGSLNSDAADFASYIAGTDPNNPQDQFRLDIQTMTNGVIQVSFQSVQAQGVGYEGLTRYYALETTTNLQSEAWLSVTNYSRIPGANQVTIYTNSTTPMSPPAFFRARVWLEGP